MFTSQSLLRIITASTTDKDLIMYTCYEVVLVAEDGEYIQETFQSESAAYNYIFANRCHYGEGQELVINPKYRGF